MEVLPQVNPAEPPAVEAPLPHIGPPPVAEPIPNAEGEVIEEDLDQVIPEAEEIVHGLPAYQEFQREHRGMNSDEF